MDLPKKLTLCNDKDIIFFPLHYPFAFDDAYIDGEVNLFASKSRKFMVITSNTTDSERRETPPSVFVYRFNASTQKKTFTNIIYNLLNLKIYGEFISSVWRYNTCPSLTLFKEIFAFRSRVSGYVDFIEKVIQEQQLNTENLLLYNYWMLESSMASVLLKKKYPKLTVISKAHSLDVYFFRSPVNYLPYRKYIFDRLNHLYFISENAKNYFTEKHQLSLGETKKTSVSRIGIYGPATAITKPASAILRIISVAFIQKLKRIELIVDALSLINNFTVEWYHIGSGATQELFDNIQQYASQKLSGKSNIRYFFTGLTSKGTLFKLYQEKVFDVLLNVSDTEGIPVSMMEAISYSVPIIGTNVGGVAEIIEDGVNGFLLPANVSARQVADKLQNFYAMDNNKKQQLRINAFKSWQEKYSAEKNYPEFVKEVLGMDSK